MGRQRRLPPSMAIVDWRDVPTWSEFEILRDASSPPACRPSSAIRATWSSTNGRSRRGGRRDRSRLSPRAHQRHRRASRRVRGARRGIRARLVCVANTFRCKLPHKKAFFAVLTDDRQRCSRQRARGIAAHVPWTRWFATRNGRTATAADRSALAYPRAARALRAQAERRIRRQGVMLGWESDASDVDRGARRALARPAGHVDRAGAIPVRRETFPHVRRDARRRCATCSSTSRPICSAAGWAAT